MVSRMVLRDAHTQSLEPAESVTLRGKKDSEGAIRVMDFQTRESPGLSGWGKSNHRSPSEQGTCSSWKEKRDSRHERTRCLAAGSETEGVRHED